MLSNTDFADLLKSGSSNGLTSESKSRFGLEQVKTWDKQNDAKGKKKPSSFGKTPARGGDNEDVVKPDKYRDRALERRKEIVTSEEAALEAVVSKLDAEQTKFLGGDVEHTHLVRGLDYALLRKIRNKEKEQNETEVEDNKKSSDENSSSSHQSSDRNVTAGKKAEIFKDFRTSSVMAENLKNMLFNPDSTLFIQKKGIANRSNAVANTISRTAFDFDLSEDGETDLPTIISKSKKDQADGADSEVAVSSLLSKALNEKLSILFGKNAAQNAQQERLLLKRKRKEQLLEEKQKYATMSKVAAKNTVEDIFADVGKYVPVGALDDPDEKDENELNSVKMDISVTESKSVIAENSRMKGLFSNLLPSFPTKIKMSENVAEADSKEISDAANVNAACLFDDDSDNEIEMAANKNNLSSSKSIPTKTKTRTRTNIGEEELDGDDKKITSDSVLMAPIRALLTAQAVREKASLEKAEELASRGREGLHNKSDLKQKQFSSLAVGADGKSRVHRDVFGVVGNSGSAGGRQGSAMGGGSYDDYGGDNETYDSDFEDENEGKDKDKSSGAKTAEEVENPKDGKRIDYKEIRKSKEKDKGLEKDADKDKDKNKNGEKSRDSSGNWRNSSGGNKDTGHAGTGEKQSAIRPRVENNRAARRAGK